MSGQDGKFSAEEMLPESPEERQVALRRAVRGTLIWSIIVSLIAGGTGVLFYFGYKPPQLRWISAVGFTYALVALTMFVGGIVTQFGRQAAIWVVVGGAVNVALDVGMGVLIVVGIAGGDLRAQIPGLMAVGMLVHAGLALDMMHHAWGVVRRRAIEDGPRGFSVEQRQ